MSNSFHRARNRCSSSVHAGRKVVAFETEQDYSGIDKLLALDTRDDAENGIFKRGARGH